jgi:hypothetical protein
MHINNGYFTIYSSRVKTCYLSAQPLMQQHMKDSTCIQLTILKVKQRTNRNHRITLDNVTEQASCAGTYRLTVTTIGNRDFQMEPSRKVNTHGRTFDGHTRNREGRSETAERSTPATHSIPADRLHDHQRALPSIAVALVGMATIGIGGHVTLKRDAAQLQAARPQCCSAARCTAGCRLEGPSRSADGGFPQPAEVDGATAVASADHRWTWCLAAQKGGSATAGGLFNRPSWRA